MSEIKRLLSGVNWRVKDSCIIEDVFEDENDIYVKYNFNNNEVISTLGDFIDMVVNERRYVSGYEEYIKVLIHHIKTSNIIIKHAAVIDLMHSIYSNNGNQWITGYLANPKKARNVYRMYNISLIDNAYHISFLINSGKKESNFTKIVNEESIELLEKDMLVSIKNGDSSDRICKKIISLLRDFLLLISYKKIDDEILDLFTSTSSCSELSQEDLIEYNMLLKETVKKIIDDNDKKD